MEREITDNLLDSAKPDVPNAIQRRFEALKSFVPEGVVFGGLVLAEYGRATLVNPESLTNALEPAVNKPPILTPDNTPDLIYEPLQHAGNIPEGFMLPWLFYNAMTAIIPTEKLEAARLAISVLFTNAIVYAAETGKVYDMPADYLDIPAGTIASFFFVGVHFGAKRLVKWFNKEIKNTEIELASEEAALDK